MLLHFKVKTIMWYFILKYQMCVGEELFVVLHALIVMNDGCPFSINVMGGLFNKPSYVMSALPLLQPQLKY